MNRDDLIERAAGVLRVHHIADGPADRAQAADACACGPLVEDWDEHWAEALADAGLLADSEQHAVLSPEVSQTILQLGRDLAAARRAQVVAEERELAAERRETLRQDERDALQARLDAFQRWLRPEVVVGWIQPRGYRERYLAEDVIRGLIAGDPIADDQWSEDGKREFARAAWNDPANQPAGEADRG